MGWLRNKVLNDEKRSFISIGFLGIMEILNFGFLGGLPYRGSIIISVLLFGIATYLFILQYMNLKERYKSYLHKNHLELATKLEDVARGLSSTEDRLTNLASEHYKNIVENLANVDERLSKSIGSAAEVICAAIESSEKKVVSVTNKNKEDVLEDNKIYAEGMKKDSLQFHQDTSNQINQVKEQIVGEVNDRSQHLATGLIQVENTISETIKSEANQTVVTIGRVSEQLSSIIGELKDQSTASMEIILHHTSQTEDTLISSVKSESQQMSSLISHAKEQIAGSVVEFKEQLVGSFEELKEQNNRITDQIIEKTLQIQETVTTSNKSGGSQLSTLIDDVRVQISSSIDELKGYNAQSTKDLLEKASQTEASVISSVKIESQQIGSLINQVNEQMSGAVNELKEQNTVITDKISEKTSELQELVELEGSRLSTNIDDVRVQMTSSIDDLKDLNHQSTIDLLEKAGQTEEKFVSSMKFEGNQVGALIGEVREQVASAFDEITKQNQQSMAEILGKTSQDYLATANGINEGIEKVDKEIKEKAQLVMDGITRRFDTLLGSVQETSDQVQVMKVSTEAGLAAYNEGIQTKWNDLTGKMESVDSHNENRLNRTKEMIDAAIVSMKIHTDQSANYTTSRLAEAFEKLTDQNLSKLSSTILDVNQTISQTLNELETNVIGKIDWLNLDQAELKKLISESIQKDKENNELVLQHMNHVSEELIGIQNKAFQNVLDHFKVDQENKEMTERIFNQQVSGLSENLSILEGSMKKTILQMDSWKNEQLQKGDKILALLNNVYELDSNLGQASKHLYEQQETFGKKVDALIFQMNSIDALIKTLKSNSGNAKTVTVEEKQKSANRIEKINDDENGVLIINQYQHDVLRNSEMHQNGKKVYVAEYDRNGDMIASKNFDYSGKLLTEMTYYPNGAIKERKENVKRNGKVVTQISKFNQNGVKIK